MFQLVAGCLVPTEKQHRATLNRKGPAILRTSEPPCRFSDYKVTLPHGRVYMYILLRSIPFSWAKLSETHVQGNNMDPLTRSV